jgi:biotin transport system substrate-specific component
MKISIEKMVATAVFTALIVVGALINNGAPVVPIVLSNFFCLLAGLYLGKTYGPLAVIIYLLLGIFGLPVYAKGGVGIGTFLTASGGWLAGFVIMAFVAGWLRETKVENLWVNIAAAVFAMTVLYLIGTPYMPLVSDYYAMDFAKAAGEMLPLFLIKDLPLAVGAGILFHFTYPQIKPLLGEENQEGESHEQEIQA